MATESDFKKMMGNKTLTLNNTTNYVGGVISPLKSLFFHSKIPRSNTLRFNFCNFLT